MGVLSVETKNAVRRGRLRALGLEKGFWILADQGVVSLGNFLTNVLLARNLSLTEYGAYAFVLVTLIVLNIVQSSLITHALFIEGAESNQDELRRLTSISLVITLFSVLLVGGLVIGVVVVALGRPELAPWVLCALLLWQLQDSIRRGLMAHQRYREALPGDLLAYLGQAGLIWFLVQRGRPSLEAVFVIMAVTSLLAAAAQAGQLGLKFATFGEALGPAKSSVIASFGEVWKFAGRFAKIGSWVLLTNLIGSLAIQMLLWELTLFHGLKATASLQAITNVLSVTHPVLNSVTWLIAPAVIRAYLEGGVKTAWRSTLTYAVQLGALLLPFYAVIVLAPGTVLKIFYGAGSPYLEFGVALRLWALSYAVLYLEYVLGAFLHSLYESRAVFHAQLGGALATIVVGLPLIVGGGVIGTAAGMLIIAVVRVVALSWFVRGKMIKG